MKVFLTLGPNEHGPPHDVVVQAPDATTLGELLASSDETPGPRLRVSPRGRRIIDASAPLSTAVADGDLLAPLGGQGPDASHASAGSIVLAVVSGPCAGESWILAIGPHLVGRAVDADVALPADGQVSRRHAELVVGEESLAVRDLNSANGVFVDGRETTECSVPAGSFIRVGESVLSWSIAPTERTNEPEVRTETFNRPPRIVAPLATAQIEAPGEPPTRQRNPFPVVALVIPLVMGGVLVLATRQATYALFMLLGPVAMVATFFSTRRSGGKTFRQLHAEYQQRVQDFEAQMAAAVSAQTTEARAGQPDAATLVRIVIEIGPRLWERRREDDDVLLLRLGLTSRSAAVKFTGDRRDERVAPELDDIPATVHLAHVGHLGVAGPREAVDAIGRWLLAQSSALHAPDDLTITILTHPQRDTAWSWTRWLPHTRPGDSECAARIASNDAGIARLAGEMAQIVETRAASRSRRDDGDVHRHLILLDGAHDLGALPAVTRILRDGPDVGVHCLCLDSATDRLPEECRAVAVVNESEPTRLDLEVSGAPATRSVLSDQVNAVWSERLSRAMAPLRLNRQTDTAAVVPTSVRLLDVLALEPPTAAAILERWAANGRTTAVRVGATAAGPFELDLATDGPHGLVAGTTGSGKSEFLQSLIASLAVANRPDALNFVLVDYKGGSAFKECAQLPHTVGLVTDLDGHLTERAIESLGAELRRRERLFQAAGAADIADYWDKTDGETSSPLARLVIVVDEFAALAMELPGFVDRLVDLAARGRSLGLNLILATQRPAGVVTPKMKTNIPLRVAMRVTDGSDSIDVIETNAAAAISKSTPGRAFAWIGHERLVEFQSARVAGHSVGATAAVLSTPVEWATLAIPLPKPTASGPRATDTDLARLVAAVREATDSQAPLSPSRPWLEPLPEVVVVTPDTGPEESICYGMIDRPREQSQLPATLDLASGHMVIGGDAGSGRTTALRTIASQLASRFSPSELHIYGYDGSAGGLSGVASLPHCAAIVTRADPYRVDRLVTRLQDETRRRQAFLAEHGYTNLEDQRRAAHDEVRPPYIVVLINRWETFLSDFEPLDGGRLVTGLLGVMKEGRGVGIKFILAGDRSALAARVTALAENIIVLRLNDRSTYSSIGVNPRSLPESIPPGRAFTAQSGLELQIGVLGEDVSGTGQLAALAERASHLDPGPASARPLPIQPLPSALDVSDSRLADGGSPQSLLLTIGLGGDRLGAVTFDPGADGPAILIAGAARSGRSNTLAAIALSAITRGFEVAVITAGPSPLATWANRPGVIHVANSQTSDPSVLQQSLAGSSSPVLVVLDDIDRLGESPFGDVVLLELRRTRPQPLVVAASGVPTELSGGFRGLVPELRKSGTGILLNPTAPADADPFGQRLPRTFLFPTPSGRAVYVRRAGILALQVPLIR